MATAVDFEPFVSPPLAGGPMRFHTIRDAGELAEWRPAWQTLDDAVATPMETFDWMEAAAATFGNDGDVEIIVAHRDGQALAAAPLIALPGALGRRWHALNYHRVYEPAELASSSPESLAALTEELISRGRPIFFERTFADAPTRAVLESATQPRGWTRLGPQAGTPWIPLDASWSTPEDKISSRRRSDLRRARKHAEQLGRVVTHSHAPKEYEVDELLDLAFDVEGRSWKGEAGTALALSRSGDFYRRYARAAARQGKLRIELLHIADQTAAMQIGVVHQHHYWVLKVGYDPQFQRTSPGILLMVAAIQQSVAEGLDAYELLGTVEPWIQVWTRHEHRCESWRFYPRGVRGMGALGADLAQKACRRVQGSGFRIQHFFRARSGDSELRQPRAPSPEPLAFSSQPLVPILRRAVSACLLPLAQRAARAYIAGPELTDALRVAAELAEKGFASTLGFWDGQGDSPRSVADHHLTALDALAASGRGDYLSIKLPALQGSRLLLGEVLDRARQLGVRIHFDSLGPETADAMWSAVSDAAGGGVELSCSLPGRWRRSLDDAETAIGLGVVPRVVKGQWADAEQPDQDLRQGFLDVIDRLAGRAPRVAVASHDAPLARQAIQRLRAAGSDCELELLYGLPQRASLALAAAERVPVRFYVPYGQAYLPYCLGQIRRQPWLLWWLLRDSLRR